MSYPRTVSQELSDCSWQQAPATAQEQRGTVTTVISHDGSPAPRPPRRSFLRVGAVVCVINDACDIWFEAAKLASYARREQLSALFYCSFAATWFALRMVYAPLVILPSVWNEAWGLVVRYGASDFHVGLWATFNALLAVLQLQHVYWWYFIAAKIHLTASITIVNNPKRKKRSGSKEGGSFGAGSSTDGEGSSADLVELERLSAGGATGGKRSRASSPGAESE